MRSIFVSHWTSIQNDIPESNSLQDIKQNHWTAKYRSRTYIYIVRSIFVSHWSIIPSMTFLHQIIFKILSKITDPWNIGQWSTYILWGQSLCHTDRLYQVRHFSTSLQDIKQNHWTMKYRSITYTYFMRSIFVSHWSIIPSMTFIHQTVFKILGKITQPWNIGHNDLHLMTQSPRHQF